MSIRARHARIVAIASSETSTILQRPPWQAEAACVDQPPSAFFEESGNPRDWKERAVAICTGCEVRAECLTYAIETQQPAGIWGGFDTSERFAIARDLNRGVSNY